MLITDKEDCPRIELDLACGILDLKSEEATNAAERALNGQIPNLSAHTDCSVDFSSAETSDSDTDSDESSESEFGENNLSHNQDAENEQSRVPSNSKRCSVPSRTKQKSLVEEM